MSHVLSGNTSNPAVFWPVPWPIKPTAYISLNDPNHALPLVLFQVSLLRIHTSGLFRYNEWLSQGCQREHRRTNTVPIHTSKTIVGILVTTTL